MDTFITVFLFLHFTMIPLHNIPLTMILIDLIFSLGAALQFFICLNQTSLVPFPINRTFPRVDTPLQTEGLNSRCVGRSYRGYSLSKTSDRAMARKH